MLHGVAVQQKLECIEEVRNGANWFYWIAGLSIVNTLFTLSGSDHSFAAGLGLTSFLDASVAIIFPASTAALAIEITVSVAIVVFWLFLGLRANKFDSWAFVVGMIFYGIDLFIVLYL
ncbi:MAG: hypothetical protein JNL32_12795 [Candidatus Kapabacteria bacterium]|nr:hypothetical protein [Candidatus Kapabacteria bacterium]